MKITLEDVEKVMEETGVKFEEAKEMLKNVEGDIEEAVGSFKEEVEEKLQFGDEVFEEEKKVSRRKKHFKKEEKYSDEDIIKKLKALVKEGNVDRIVVKRKGEKILSIPVNVGLVGGVVGIAAAPWAMIAGVLAAYGTSCTVEVIKKNGTDEKL